MNKPRGITSFEAVRRIGTRLAKSRVGHTGTLDKFASGLLLVLAGNCTRLGPMFLSLDKEYRATLRLGRETDTLDPEGRIIRETGIPALSEVEAIMPEFLGEILQAPPAYSAVHVHGERAYKIARRGESVSPEKRKIRIDSIKIADFDPPYLTISVSCASGTYIRSLARDMAQKAGSCGYLESLVRTRIGGFSLDEGIAIEELVPEKHVQKPYDFIDRITGIEKRTVKEEYVTRVRCGQPVLDEYLFEPELSSYLPARGSGVCALFDVNGNLIAVVRKENAGFRYTAVMA